MTPQAGNSTLLSYRAGLKPSRLTISLDTGLGPTVRPLKDVFIAKSKMCKAVFPRKNKNEMVLWLLRGEEGDGSGVTKSGHHGCDVLGVARPSRAGRPAGLKALIGDLTMRLKQFRETVSRLKAGAPLGRQEITRGIRCTPAI